MISTVHLEFVSILKHCENVGMGNSEHSFTTEEVNSHVISKIIHLMNKLLITFVLGAVESGCGIFSVPVSHLTSLAHHAHHDFEIDFKCHRLSHATNEFLKSVKLAFCVSFEILNCFSGNLSEVFTALGNCVNGCLLEANFSKILITFKVILILNHECSGTTNGHT